jgi:hypothetical protein
MYKFNEIDEVIDNAYLVLPIDEDRPYYNRHRISFYYDEREGIYKAYIQGGTNSECKGRLIIDSDLSLLIPKLYLSMVKFGHLACESDTTGILQNSKIQHIITQYPIDDAIRVDDLWRFVGDVGTHLVKPNPEIVKLVSDETIANTIYANGLIYGLESKYKFLKGGHIEESHFTTDLKLLRNWSQIQCNSSEIIIDIQTPRVTFILEVTKQKCILRYGFQDMGGVTVTTTRERKGNSLKPNVLKELILSAVGAMSLIEKLIFNEDIMEKLKNIKGEHEKTWEVSHIN